MTLPPAPLDVAMEDTAFAHRAYSGVLKWKRLVFRNNSHLTQPSILSALKA